MTLTLGSYMSFFVNISGARVLVDKSNIRKTFECSIRLSVHAHRLASLNIAITMETYYLRNRTPPTIGLAAPQLEQYRVALTTRLVAPHNAPQVVPEVDLSDQTVEDATSVKSKITVFTVSCLRMMVSR